MNEFEKELTAVMDNAWSKPRTPLKSQLLSPGFREPDPPVPFKHQANNGLWLNVRPEKRGNRFYWFVDKQLDGQRHHLYIAPAGQLSRVLLENAAIHIKG